MLCAGIPKTRFDAVLGGLTGLSAERWCSWPWFITVEGCNTRQQREKGAQGEGPGKLGMSFHESSLSGVDVFNFSRIKLWQHVWNMVYRGSLLETDWPGTLLEAGYLDILCLACTEILVSNKESRCSSMVQSSTISFAQTVWAPWATLYQSVSHCLQLGWWEPPKNPSLKTPAKGQSWKQDLIRISSLRPACAHIHTQMEGFREIEKLCHGHNLYLLRVLQLQGLWARQN